MYASLSTSSTYIHINPLLPSPASPPALDPTKLKNRQFSRSTTDKKSAASNLWTETPQERQQRLADEISGKRKRAENATTTTAEDEDVAKRRKRDRDLREQVEAHNVRLLFFILVRVDFV